MPYSNLIHSQVGLPLLHGVVSLLEFLIRDRKKKVPVLVNAGSYQEITDPGGLYPLSQRKSESLALNNNGIKGQGSIGFNLNSSEIIVKASFCGLY